MVMVGYGWLWLERTCDDCMICILIEWVWRRRVQAVGLHPSGTCTVFHNKVRFQTPSQIAWSSEKSQKIFCRCLAVAWCMLFPRFNFRYNLMSEPSIQKACLKRSKLTFKTPHFGTCIWLGCQRLWDPTEPNNASIYRTRFRPCATIQRQDDDPFCPQRALLGISCSFPPLNHCAI